MGLFRTSKSRALSHSSSNPSQAMKGVVRAEAQQSPSPDPGLEVGQTTHESAIFVSTSQNENAPIYKLPIEVIQLISSFLPPSSGAAFCLSTRFICYAVGTQQLHTYLTGPKSKIDKRKNIEVLERAFTSHWYCSWCDRFHRRDASRGPRDVDSGRVRDCDEFNSYLHAGRDYILTYQHARLAMNRHLWGPDYGIPLDEFTFTRNHNTTVFKPALPTQLSVSAKIISNRLFLHSTFTIALSPSALQKKSFYSRLYTALPQIVYGHRNDHSGHSGMLGGIEQALSKHWKYNTQLCSECATDYLVRVYFPEANSSSDDITLSIQVWRDLGSCRNPFDACWRAHGELGDAKPGFWGDTIRLTSYKAGEIRESWELGITLNHSDDGWGNHLGRPLWWDMNTSVPRGKF